MAWLLALGFVLSQSPPVKFGFEEEVRAAKLPPGQAVLVIAPQQLADPNVPVSVDLAGVAKRYGRVLLRVGGVTSFAPPTMRSILPVAKEPNPFLGLSPRDAFRLLASRLSGKGWAALTGAEGLGVDDLATSDDQLLFASVVRPGGRLKVVKEGETRDMTETAAKARLRLSTEIRVKLAQGGMGYSSASPPGRYFVRTNEATPDGRLMGAEAFRIAPNAVKPSQLNYEAPELQKEIDLAGVTKIGELVDRVAQTCGYEIYTDPRYADRWMCALGESRAKASEVLRGLALGVTGTFRRVGPAYVFTDSLVGVGALRAGWMQFAERGYTRLNEEMVLAEGRLAKDFDPRTVRESPNTFDYTPEQKGRAQRRIEGELSGLETTFGSLTPAQKQAAQLETQRGRPEETGRVIPNDEKVYLSQSYRLDLLHPELDAPAILPGLSDVLGWKPAPSAPSSPEKAGEQWKRFAHRAAILSPAGAKYGPLLKSLVEAGVKEVWLDVDGPISSALRPAVEALRAKGLGVRLYLNVFPPAPTGPDSDRSISGEVAPTPRPDSPTAIAKQKEIETAVLALKVDSVVVKRPFPPGYSRRDKIGFPEDERLPLGYSPEARLAFLRSHSADPIDLSTLQDVPGSLAGMFAHSPSRVVIDASLARSKAMWAATGLENFSASSNIEEDLDRAWNDARYAHLEKSLADFCARMSKSVSCLVTSTRTPITHTWIGEWKGVGSAPGRDIAEWHEQFEPRRPIGEWQKASARPVFLPVKVEADTEVEKLTLALLRAGKLGAEGVVLDLREAKAVDANLRKKLAWLDP